MRVLFSPRLLLSLLILVLSTGCSVAPYRYDNSIQATVEARVTEQQRGSFTIKAAVPGRTEAEQIFGIPLHKRGIQAVWLEISNQSSDRARFAPYSLDSKYFPPHEVAYMFRKDFSKQGWLDMEARFVELALPRYIAVGETVSGYVFTHEDEGTKAFNVDIFYTGGKAEFEHFTFFIDVPGFTPDHAEIDFANLYGPEKRIDVGPDGLRGEIAAIPCCTTDQQGSRLGQPIEVFVVAKGHDLLQALLRAGWDETGLQRDPNYLSAADYFYGRPADAIFRKKRGGTRFSTERNEIGVWLTPIVVDGTPVWAIQVKHAIGRRFQIQEQFLGVNLDPDVNDGRNFLMQNFWYSHALEQMAWSATGKAVPEDAPVLDFNNNAWFSDGLRLVVWVSGEPVSLSVAKTLDWDRPVDYVPGARK